MNWYYADNGQQKGPLSEMDFTLGIREGLIKPDTLVWREGLPNWLPVSQVRPDLIAVTGAPVIAGMAVSEQNKDLLVQQMREGALPADFGAANPLGLRFAGFWIRVAAKVIDWIIVGVVNTAFSFLIFGSMFMTMDQEKLADMENNPEAMVTFWISYFAMIGISLGLHVAYNALMVWKWGATLGKLAVGIKIIRADGLPLQFGRSLGRAFADLLNSFICYLTYLMPAFDEPEKRGLHDHICGTRVIYK